jgi:hypothetical protein
MNEAIAYGILFILCYTLFGLGLSAMIDSTYDIDIPVACMLFWPIIVLIMAIIELCKLIRKLRGGLKE